jgi:UPF0176 protein
MYYTVLLFYKYVTIKDTPALMAYLRGVCEALSLKGRIILAEEGINGTLEGRTEDAEKFLELFLADRRFKNIDVKKSEGTGEAFPKLSIKVRNEIVSTQFPKHIDPRKKTGKHLKPEELYKWYEEGKDFVVVDMRNSYEIKSGFFEKTVDPGLKASRDLPSAVEKLRIHQDKTIVTTCTGGVRCEKMSAYLLDQGFKNVYQLHNGMHSYMEKYPGKHFKGTLYTFDNRKVMDFGGEREVVGKCLDCSAQTEEYYDLLNKEGEEEQVLLCAICAAKRSHSVRK